MAVCETVALMCGRLDCTILILGAVPCLHSAAAAYLALSRPAHLFTKTPHLQTLQNAICSGHAPSSYPLLVHLKGSGS